MILPQHTVEMEEKASILIVDDNSSLCRTMSLILKRKGYFVAAAGDGVEAIARVRERPFDIIFMDIKMPFMDGVETYKAIKGIRPEAVVVMMTAYTVEDMVQDALQEGVYAIIYKPLDMENAIALIKRAMEVKRGALILVVDDDTGDCITLRNILSKKGYEVGIAHSGEEAVAMARKHTYDISFIDMKMPLMNGLETYLAIKEVNPQGIAIIMTAYRQMMAELVEEALKNNACACLDKPLDMEEVLQLIEEVLRQKGRYDCREARDGHKREHPDYRR